MPVRKTPKKSTPKEPETNERYNAILLEDIQSKMELVIEGMQATRSELKSDMQKMEARLSANIKEVIRVIWAEGYPNSLEKAANS